jgi:hypothetical protein
MSALTITPAPASWARAAAVLLVTLLAHLWLLDAVQHGLGSTPAPAAPVAAVTARLLPPPPLPSAAPQPAPPRQPKPKPRRVPAASPPPAPAAAAVPPAAPVVVPTPPAVSAEAPSEAPPPAELQADVSPAPPAAVRNAERPIDTPAAIDAIEFDATGPALRAALEALPAVQTALPTAARYVYRTTYSELRLASGTTTIDWSLVEGRYRLRMTTIALGTSLVELDSTGTVQAFGLAPDRYVETRVRRGATAANFDWQARRVTFSARSHEEPLVDGVQDRISFQFQLMLLGQALPERFRAGRQTVLRVASRDEVSIYRLRSAGRDTTSTGIGELDTVKVERVPERESEARVEVWLAPDQGWLPARLRFIDRHGRVTESVLESNTGP